MRKIFSVRLRTQPGQLEYLQHIIANFERIVSDADRKPQMAIINAAYNHLTKISV